MSDPEHIDCDHYASVGPARTTARTTRERRSKARPVRARLPLTGPHIPDRDCRLRPVACSADYSFSALARVSSAVSKASRVRVGAGEKLTPLFRLRFSTGFDTSNRRKGRRKTHGGLPLRLDRPRGIVMHPVPKFGQMPPAAGWRHVCSDIDPRTPCRRGHFLEFGWASPIANHSTGASFGAGSGPTGARGAPASRTTSRSGDGHAELLRSTDCRRTGTSELWCVEPSKGKKRVNRRAS